MGSLLLVRHGQASYGAADYDVLSSLGEQQASLLGGALRSRAVRPAWVWHGAMRRQRHTAELLAAAAGWGCPVEEDADWDELDHQAVLSRVPRPFGGEEHTPAQFQEWFELASRRWYGGAHDADYDEPFPAFTGRVEAALGRAASALGRGDTGVVVTSGGPIGWLTAHLLAGPAGPDGAAGARAAYARLAPVVVNTSVSLVTLGRRGPALVTFNDHAHVQGEPGLLTYR